MYKLKLILLFITIASACKKAKPSYDVCDQRSTTVLVATNWTGTLGYYNDLRKWAINVPIPYTIDGVRTCIVCNDIPDSLKKLGKIVTFSGNLKATNGKLTPTIGGQEIYYVTPELLK